MTQHDTSPGAPVDTEEVLERTTRQLQEMQKALQALQSSARFATLRENGTCPIFWQDHVVHVALPWADCDTYQAKLLARHLPLDDLYLRQLLDFVPSLEGRALVDVGSFTGTDAMILRALTTPRETHLIEPQKSMRDALEATIAANGAETDTFLHTDVIGQADQEIVLGTIRPDRLFDATYLVRAEGPLRARAIDDLGIEKIGLINLDFANAKIDALRGALKTIETDRPVITMDLSARDVNEVVGFFEPFDYEDARIGRNALIFLPR